MGARLEEATEELMGSPNVNRGWSPIATAVVPVVVAELAPLDLDVLAELVAIELVAAVAMVIVTAAHRRSRLGRVRRRCRAIVGPMWKTVLITAMCSVTTGAISVAVSWKITTSRFETTLSAYAEEREAIRRIDIKGLREIDESFALDYAKLRERVEVLETTVVSRRVDRPRPQTIQLPTAHWWCYFGRECFRAKSDCIEGASDREAECRPREAAYCGGLHGTDCFADVSDCINLEGKLTVYGGQGSAVRGCVRVE